MSPIELFRAPAIDMAIGSTPDKEIKAYDDEGEYSAHFYTNTNIAQAEFLRSMRLYVKLEKHHVGLIIFNKKDERKDLVINEIDNFKCNNNGWPYLFEGGGIKCNLMHVSAECDILFCFWWD